MQHGEATGRVGPLLVVAAGIGVMIALVQWFQVGPTTSGPESTSEVPGIAAPVTTTTSTTPVTTAPASTTSQAPTSAPVTTTVPRQSDPEPVRLDSALGSMVWQRVEVDLESGVEWYSMAPGLRADGSVVVLVANESEISMSEWAPGEDWGRRPVEGFESGVYVYPWPLVLAGDSLMTVIWGPDAPQVWYEESPGSWNRSDVEVPEFTEQWLTPRWIHPTILPVADGIDLFGGYRGRAIDWPALMGRPASVPEYWWWDVESGHLVVNGEDGAETTFDVDVSATSDVLTVKVTDRETGETIADATAETADAEAILDAMQMNDHEGYDTAFTPLRWHSDGGRRFRLVPGGSDRGFGTPLNRTLAHSPHGYVAVESLWNDETGRPEGRLLLSDDGAAWEDITSRLPEEPLELVSVAARNGTVALMSRAEARHEIADKVTAVGIVTTMYVSDDLELWTAVPFGDPGRSELNEVVTGPVGWVATGEECEVECIGRVWVSADARAWTELSLPSASIYGIPFVGENGIVLFGHPEVEFGQYHVWVGTLER